MKTIILFMAVIGCACAEQYDTKYDDVDLEPIFADKQMLKMLLNCLTDHGKCNDIMAFYKKVMLEVLQTSCAKCNLVQKHKVRRLIEALSEKDPDGLELLKQKYDPQGKYFETLQAMVASA